MKITSVRIQNCENPMGMDQAQPVFGWQVETECPNWRQQNYEITVKTLPLPGQTETVLWQSGKKQSNLMANILYQGTPLPPDTQCGVTVLSYGTNGESAIGQGTFTTGLPNPALWQGVWLGETDTSGHQMLRTDFALQKPVHSARLYVCGLGHHSFFVNGKAVTSAVLEPGWTNYNKSCLYNVYDIKSLLQNGENAMGALLGDGMFHAPEERYVYYSRSFGRAKLLVQCNIVFTDGTSQSIVTNPAWQTAQSPYLFCSMYAGEDYDARLEQEGCFAPGFSAHTWQPAICVSAPQGALVSRLQPALATHEQYTPQRVIVQQDGYLYDLGKNFSGWVRIVLEQATSGAVVTLQPAEILDAEGNVDQRVTGKGYHWQYIANEKAVQVYTPRFTYTGFRYVKVTGAVPPDAKNPNHLPVLREITGQFIYPQGEAAGKFECSVPLWNSIHSIVLQAIKSNTKSIFTDCPHRERLGWLEETHLIGPGILYNLPLQNLYEKIAWDMVEAQRENGLIPDIAPEYVVFGYHEGFVDSPEWGSALILNAWYLYQRFGSLATVMQHYEAMKAYTLYLNSRTHHSVLHHGLGDWLDVGPCTPYSQNTPVPVVATSIYYFVLTRMAFFAQQLEKHTDAALFQTLADSVYDEYQAQFYDKETGRYATGSQAAQALSLVAGLVPQQETEKVLAHLRKDLRLRNYAVTAGDIGHPFLMAALTQHGSSDIIACMTDVTDRPGYGYQVMCGATTLAEEWDGPDPARPHGSQNHLMLGSIEEWFYAGLLGLCSVRTDHPFDEIVIRPHFAQQCDWAEGYVMHPYGKVSLCWRKQEGSIMVEFSIPAGATAVFYNEIDNTATSVGSGKHHFIVPWEK